MFAFSLETPTTLLGYFIPFRTGPGMLYGKYVMLKDLDRFPITTIYWLYKLLSDLVHFSFAFKKTSTNKYVGAEY
jgi:hypothetical protein